MKRINGNQQAYKLILVNLSKQGYRWKDIRDINHNRYRLIFGENKQPNLLLMFKRDKFRNFGKEFRDQGHTGVGDTINTIDLKCCLVEGVKFIYTTFPNGITYCISLNDFLSNSVGWKNKEGKPVRSISIHQYKQADFKEWEE